MHIKTIKDIPEQAKTILLRVDLNVPLENGQICDDTSIRNIVSTIKLLQKIPRRIILCSHLGRPKNGAEEKYSLKQILPRLEELLEQKIIFIEDLSAMGENPACYLLENTRFNPGEEANSDEFAQYLAKYADAYVNDAFSASHRAHASTFAITKYLPSYAGLALEKEIKALETILEKPSRPLTAIVGGAKISSKIDLLYNLIGKTDNLIIGGGMANSFLAARDVAIGKSLCEYDILPKAKEILQRAKDNNCNILLPVDAVVAKEFSAQAEPEFRDINAIEHDDIILDAGFNSVENIKQIIVDSKSLIWNGPMGAFELKPFSRATIEAAKFIALRTQQNGLVSVAGGGDTLYALVMAGVCHEFSYVSTAGGAFLEWMEGKILPGIEALQINDLEEGRSYV